MSHTPSHSSSTNTPVFTPAFGASYMDDNDDVDEQFGYALSLDSPANEFVFANDLANDDDNEFHTYEDDDKAACMRSMPQRDTAIAFDPMMMRSEAFMEASVPTNGKAPLFVLNTAPLSPTLGESGNFEFFLPTISKHSKAKANVASPLSPSAYISTIEVPEKERSEFYSVNPAFTSHESPAKIMETVKTALSSLKCEFTTSEAWTLNVNCLLVAELITFSINVFQLRGMSAKYEIEFVRKSGDELVFADLAEHIRSRCNEIDEDGALSLFSKTLEPWMDDKQELTGRRYAIKETEALNLIEELNCEHLHVDTLYHVARSVKNHCRHKGNRKLFVQGNDQHKNFLKGLKWMLNDCDELVRFALFVLLQFANDEELCSLFFSTPFEKSSFALQLDALLAQDSRGSSTFTSEMVGAVQHSPLFA